MTLSVCTDSVYEELATVQAMRKVNAFGIKTIEFWSWWDKDIEAIDQTRKELGMTIGAICTKFVSLTEPNKRGSYLDGLAETIVVAKKLNCRIIISQVGNRTLANEAEQQASVVEGLRLASDLLKDTGITLVIEPLNTLIDHQGYYLPSSELAAEIVTQVNRPRVKLLFDFYHQHVMGEDLLRQSGILISQIGHTHIAGYPGRHEPGSGDINYEEVIRHLKAINYTGLIGLEYFPSQEIAPTVIRWAEFIRKI